MATFFDELLNGELPSKAGSDSGLDMFESGDDDFDKELDTALKGFDEGSDEFDDFEDYTEGANNDAYVEFRQAMSTYKKYMNSAYRTFNKGKGDCVAAANDVNQAIAALENARSTIQSLDYSIGSNILGSIGSVIVTNFTIHFASGAAGGPAEYVQNSEGKMVQVSGTGLGSFIMFAGKVAALVNNIQGVVESIRGKGKVSLSDFNFYKNRFIVAINKNIAEAKRLQAAIKKAEGRKPKSVNESVNDDFSGIFDDLIGEGCDNEFDEFEEDDEFDGSEEEPFEPVNDFEDDDFEDDEPGEDGEDIDSDLAELAREVGVGGSLEGEDFNGDCEYVPKSVDDPTPAPPVEKEKDVEGDKMMAMCATPTVLDDALTVQEAVEFLESGEAEIAVDEGYMMESDLSMMLAELSASSSEIYTEAGKFASPNQKYKMTKKAKLKQLYELSLQIEARLHHDPYYPKIQKAYKIEREIKAGWRKRYGALAAKRAKRYLKNLMASKSPTLRKAAKRIAA